MSHAGDNLKDTDVGLDGIGHLLRDRPLIGPAYQRSYAWEKAQVEPRSRSREP